MTTKRRSDCRNAPCPTCGDTTRARHTTRTPGPPRIYRRCAAGHSSIWRRVGRGIKLVRAAMTWEEVVVRPDRWPLCAFDGCDRLRASYTDGRGTSLCAGHDKQKDRRQPLRPLLSADPRERVTQMREQGRGF